MHVFGKIMIFIGWLLIVLSTMAIIGMMQQPHLRDPSIDAFLKHPDSPSLGGTIGTILGTNMLTIPAFLIGVFACIGKNPKGKALLIISILLFLLISGIQFFPSSSSVQNSSIVPLVITVPDSEYQVSFPHPVLKRVATVAGFESIAFESSGPAANPYLRAEFMVNINPNDIGNNFRAVLNNHARLSGLQLPEITVAEDHLGMVGTYSGTKTVEGITLRIYGKMVLGDHSTVNCLIVENLDKFPSNESALFMSSIQKLTK